MLPSQLLRARVRRSMLLPLWARGTDEEIELARELIAAFEQGRRLSEIHERVEEIEEMYELLGMDYRFVRGLALLLERMNQFRRPETVVEPEKAREVVFRLVNVKYGGFVTEDMRDQALEEAARELGISKEDLESSLWADSDDFQVLISKPEISPEDLLRKYNLSLLQTSLFKALYLRIETGAAGWEVKGFLRALKRLGLMYTAERIDGGVAIEVSGPASILKMTTRYGTSLAKLIPHVVSMSHWRISARIARNKRVLSLRLDSRVRDLFPDEGIEEPQYDSSLERRFASIAEAGGWRAIREPEPLVAGRSILIPDFLLVKGPAKVYVEVMGFWTPEYVEKKIRKLSLLREPILIVARKDLLCSRTESLPKDVFYIEGSIDKVALLRKLNELEGRAMEEIALSDRDLEGDIVDLRSLARERGMRVDQLKRVLSLESYRVLGDYAIRKELLESLKTKKIPRKVKELKAMLREEGLPEDVALPLASALGYEVVWHGLDEDEAELYPAD